MTQVSKKEESRRASFDLAMEPPKLLLNMKTFKTEWEVVATKKLVPLRPELVEGIEPTTQINDEVKLASANRNDPHVEKVYDEELRGFCYELGGPNLLITIPSSLKLSKTITSTPKATTLGVKAPFLLVLLKNLGNDFSFELAVRDSQSVVRRVKFLSPNALVKTRNSQFTHSIHIPEASFGWQLCYINLQLLMHSCFQQEYRSLHAIQVAATLRIKAIWSSAVDPQSINSAELLRQLHLNHWPGGTSEPVFTFLSHASASTNTVSRASARTHLKAAKSADVERPSSAVRALTPGISQTARPQTQGEMSSSSVVTSSFAAVDSTVPPLEEPPKVVAGAPPAAAEGLLSVTEQCLKNKAAASAAVAPWEQDLYASMDMCELPPSRKGLDSQNEELWTPSLDAVIEEESQRNTADTLGAEEESVGSEGEIRRIVKLPAPPPRKRHGVAGCKTIL